MPKEYRSKGQPSKSSMRPWLNCLGFSEADLNGLDVIHVAGTKGKGSTCAFTSFFLRAHGQRTGWPKKVGLYTSPHLKQGKSCMIHLISMDFSEASK